MGGEEQVESQLDADLGDLLERTSRTFALTIPLLPEPTRRAVTIAYLLFRIADTFEDATSWSVADRQAALAELGALLASPDGARAETTARRWVESPPIAHEGYVDLLRKTARVLKAFTQLPQASQAIIREHVQRTIRGMAEYVEDGRDAASHALNDLQELRDYCYMVAGIVGEMLTELFLSDHEAVATVAAELRERAAEFGEGLQLTNILKDRLTDATEGRRFLPTGVPREAVFDLARRDLTRAEEYVAALQRAGAPRGILAFNALPQLLARATLDRVQAAGPGAKLTRHEVFEIITYMDRALAEGLPLVWRSHAPIAPDRS